MELLRHGFGVAAVTAGVPLNLVQKWLGHAQLGEHQDVWCRLNVNSRTR
ncbi:MAG: integrase/recombinase XerD, partial [Gammaproteobacteria bacterium]|nr:integrase/recombinase XerD [Gammaproteobacteria bacterium]